MNEPYHPWLVALMAEAQPDGGGALTLRPEITQRAEAELRALSPVDGESRALHIVALARALYLAHGDAVARLVEQLALLAAVALSDPRALRDMLEHASVNAATIQRVLGQTTSSVPVETNGKGVSPLDLRLGRSRRP